MGEIHRITDNRQNLSPNEITFVGARENPKISEMKQQDILKALKFILMKAMDVTGQKKTEDDVIRAGVEFLWNLVNMKYKFLTVQEIQMAITYGLANAENTYITGANIGKFIADWYANERPKIVLSLRNKQQKELPPAEEFTQAEKLEYIERQKNLHKKGHQAFYVRAYGYMDEVTPFTIDEKKASLTAALPILNKEKQNLLNLGMRNQVAEVEKAIDQIKSKQKLTNTKAIAACKAAAVIARFKK